LTPYLLGVITIIKILLKDLKIINKKFLEQEIQEQIYGQENLKIFII
jgi:hypothetical protein